MSKVVETCNSCQVKNSHTEQSNNFNEIAGSNFNEVDTNNSEAFFDDMSANSDFWNKVQVCADKFVRGQVWDVPLLGERIFFLNKSRSKWVCTGLSIDSNFEPVVKIGGVKKQCIAFYEQEWELFMAESVNIKGYFEYCRGIFPMRDLQDIKLSSECFDGVTRILKIERAGDCVFLSFEGLSELLRMKKVVSTRVALLKSLKFHDFYKSMVIYLSKTAGDLSNEVEKMFEGIPTESTALTTELLTYGFQKMYSDVNAARRDSK